LIHQIKHPDFSFFLPYYNLLEEIITHAAFASQIVKQKKERAELEELIHVNSREIDLIEMLLNNASIEKVLIDDLID
jgi:hypothetical protein